MYSNGQSERIMGEALRKYNIPRNKIVLMTKCYRVLCDAENYDPGSGVTMHHEMADKSKDYVNHWGESDTVIGLMIYDMSFDRPNTFRAVTTSNI